MVGIGQKEADRPIGFFIWYVTEAAQMLPVGLSNGRYANYSQIVPVVGLLPTSALQGLQHLVNLTRAFFIKMPADEIDRKINDKYLKHE